MNIHCAPGEGLPAAILEELRLANADRGKNNFSWYLRKLHTIFQVDDSKIHNEATVEEKLFFAGFIIGEGSINVSAKKEKRGQFGVILDPEFSVTQHVNGILYLLLAFNIFKTGSLRYKTGSNATLVYRIDNRETLLKKVIPFYERYCTPYWSPEHSGRLTKFKQLLILFQKKRHLHSSTFLSEMLPLWDEMRKQKAQSNSSFPSLEAAQAYVTDFVKGKREGSSETARNLV